MIDGARILYLRTVLDRVVVSDPMRDYACRLVLATHPDSEFAPERVKKYLRWGASPRAAQALIRAGRVRALSQGRAHVSFDDIRSFAHEVLQHRVLLNYDGLAMFGTGIWTICDKAIWEKLAKCRWYALRSD